MKKGGGLTEKKMKNKRFRKIEDAIFATYFSLKHFPNAGKVARLAKVSRSTLYRHHSLVHEIPEDYERYVLIEFSHLMKRTRIQKTVDKRMIFRRMLIFILAHKKILSALLDMGRDGVIRGMIQQLRRKLKKEIHESYDYKNNEAVNKMEEIFDVLEDEIFGIVRKWGKDGFNDTEIDLILNRIMYLVETARPRLRPLFD